jgi:hypothetical protein
MEKLDRGIIKTIAFNTGKSFIKSKFPSSAPGQLLMVCLPLVTLHYMVSCNQSSSNNGVFICGQSVAMTMATMWDIARWQNTSKLIPCFIQ